MPERFLITTKFLGEHRKLFNTIHDLSCQAKNRVYAAIAYIGKDSYRLFNENVSKMNDVKFVVNFSNKSIKIGATNPAGVEQLTNFAEVKNKEDLHAKFYIFDNIAIICSANLSKNALLNVESGIIIDDVKDVQDILNYFKELWENSSPIDSNLISKGKKTWDKFRKLRHDLSGLTKSHDDFSFPRWGKPISTIKKKIPAIVWSVARIDRLNVKSDWSQRRDVELHNNFIKKNGAVYWSAGWKRHYTDKPINGYLYISKENIKYRLKIEKIISKTDLMHADMKFIPDCRKNGINTISTWIKIVNISKLKKPINPKSMMKWLDGKPIKKSSALQSAVKIIDEFWE